MTFRMKKSGIFFVALLLFWTATIATAETIEDSLFSQLPETLAVVDDIVLSRTDVRNRIKGRALPENPLEFAAEIRAEIDFFVQEQAMRKLLAGTKYEPSAELAATELRKTFSELQADPSLAEGKLVRGFASPEELELYIDNYASDPFQQLRIASMLYIKNEIESTIKISDDDVEKFFREHQHQLYDKEVLQCTWYAPQTLEEEQDILKTLSHSPNTPISAPRVGNAEGAALLTHPDVRKALANAAIGDCGAISVNAVRYIWLLNSRKRMGAASFDEMKEELRGALLQLQVRRRTDMLLEEKMETMTIEVDY